MAKAVKSVNLKAGDRIVFQNPNGKPKARPTIDEYDEYVEYHRKISTYSPD